MSIWNAITQSFLFNIIFSFLTIILLLYFLFKIAPHTGNVSFNGDKKDTYIDTTADNIFIANKSLSNNNIRNIYGSICSLYCQVNDDESVNDYEFIRLNGLFEYTAIDTNQLALHGINNEFSQGLFNEYQIFIGATTSSNTTKTLYELKDEFHEYFEDGLYPYTDLEEYLGDTFLHEIESSSLYSKIMQEIRGYKTNQRDIAFRYFSHEDTYSIDGTNIFLFSPGFEVHPLTEDCQIEILDPLSGYNGDIDSVEVLKTVPVRNNFVISNSNKYDEELGGCLAIFDGSCDINCWDSDSVIIIEGSKGIQAEVTGDFVFNYSNEPTELQLHNRILDLESRYGLLDIVIGEDEANKNSLSISGEITRGFVSGINLFPSFNSWYRNNVYLLPLTLITTIFTCVTLMQSKKKTAATPSWNPFDVKKEENKKDAENPQPPTIIIKLVSQSPIDASIVKDTPMTEDKDTDINPSNVSKEVDDDYIDEHPECAD